MAGAGSRRLPASARARKLRAGTGGEAPPPGRDWLRGGPAEPRPPIGAPHAVLMLGCRQGFPGRGRGGWENPAPTARVELDRAGPTGGTGAEPLPDCYGAARVARAPPAPTRPPLGPAPTAGRTRADARGAEGALQGRGERASRPALLSVRPVTHHVRPGSTTALHPLASGATPAGARGEGSPESQRLRSGTASPPPASSVAVCPGMRHSFTIRKLKVENFLDPSPQELRHGPAPALPVDITRRHPHSLTRSLAVQFWGSCRT